MRGVEDGESFAIARGGTPIGRLIPVRRHAFVPRAEVRNDDSGAMRGVEDGESFAIARGGTPIGRLIPVRRHAFVPRAEVMAAFATAAVLDHSRFRSDLDIDVEQTLEALHLEAGQYGQT
ncbi:hypothetical protein [Micromonospora okii]|uniref:hypothetical protein n=1 Tax=Micromonospora okii TaxID=1182970 RepID=UPI001E5FCECC|nr:hypothetical protein [Micromonospora okii]